MVTVQSSIGVVVEIPKGKGAQLLPTLASGYEIEVIVEHSDTTVTSVKPEVAITNTTYNNIIGTIIIPGIPLKVGGNQVSVLLSSTAEGAVNSSTVAVFGVMKVVPVTAGVVRSRV